MINKLSIRFFLALVFFASCRKKTESVNCFECVMTYVSGQPAGIQYPCTSNLAQWQQEQKDTNGQPLQSSCTRKGR